MRLSSLSNQQLEEAVERSRDQDSRGLFLLTSVCEELLDRRLEEDSELRKLERGLAYSSACSVIESHCLCHRFEGNVWFDLTTKDEEASEWVDEAVLYLDMRRLLYRIDSKPGWVSLCDEDEPLGLDLPTSISEPSPALAVAGAQPQQQS